MASKSPASPEQDQALFSELLSFAEDPYAFVMFAFPWGQPNTPLAAQQGPRSWQKKILTEIRDHIKANRRAALNNVVMKVLRSSTVSGRGIGKSALVSWLVLWMLSTQLGSTVIVTANTEAQLMSRTWAELGKWHTLAINSHWFDRTAMSLKPQAWFDSLLKLQLKIDTGYYYAQAQLWSEENPDAFAGAHNFAGIMVVFDEASGIPHPIWKVTEGFFTEPILHRYWFAFSNGRRNTGAFFETHHRDRDFWSRNCIDSRTVEGTDPEVYASIIRQYGEDSDEARVEVRGQFPRQGDSQFISREVVDEACKREGGNDRGAALVMGVDVARFGDDHSVVVFRQGRDARSIPSRRYKALDTVQLAGRVAELAETYRPDAIFVDGGGVGGGVVDRLKEMRFSVIEVQSGAKPDDASKYANKRAEMWGTMREWLLVGCIPDDEMLRDDLLGPEYRFDLQQRLKIEAKEEMKKRGLASPDIGDALALTFARQVGRRDMTVGRRQKVRQASGMDYDLFG